MARILLLIALVWLLYVVIKRAFLTSNSDNTHDKSPNLDQEKAEQRIVQCAVCGMHVPESESLLSDNKIVCNNIDCSKNT